MEPRAMIGRNLDTCKRSPPLIKLMGYEHRVDAVESRGAGNGKHTHTKCPPRYTGWMEPRAMIESNLDTCKRGSPANQINGLRTSGGRSGGWGERAMANTYTQSVPRDTQGG